MHLLKIFKAYILLKNKVLEKLKTFVRTLQAKEYRERKNRRKTGLGKNIKRSYFVAHCEENK